MIHSPVTSMAALAPSRGTLESLPAELIHHVAFVGHLSAFQVLQLAMVRRPSLLAPPSSSSGLRQFLESYESFLLLFELLFSLLTVEVALPRITGGLLFAYFFQVCRDLHAIVASVGFGANVLWQILCQRDFGVSSNRLAQFAQEQAYTGQRLYIALGTLASIPGTCLFLSGFLAERSKFSPLGLPTSACDVLGLKADPKMRLFAQCNRIAPFWVLHLYHTNNRTRYKLSQ